MEEQRAAASGAEGFALISGQHLPPWRDMPYGRSDLGYSGCEAIAAYNLMILLGRPEPLTDVIRFFEQDFSNRLLAGWGMDGRWGASPWDIRRFLKSRGVSFRDARTLKALERMAVRPGALIVSYWNRPLTTGYHTVAVVCAGDRFTAYNQNCGSARPVVTDSLGALMAGPRRFIHGFFVPRGGEGQA